MRRRIGGGLAGLLGVATAIAVLAPAALAAGPVARAARVGSAPAQRSLMLDLPLRTDAAGLARFAAAVSDPSSPEYGRYQPVATLSRRFGATPAQRRHVVSYLRSVGATDVSIDVTGQFADATMPASTAARMFGTGLASFRLATAAGVQRFVAPTAAVHVPAALAGSVTGVIGLDTERFQPPQLAPLPGAERPAPTPRGLRGLLARWTSGSSFGPSAATDVNLGSGYSPRSGTPAGCPAALAQPNGFTPNQYRQAYNIGVAPAVPGNGRGERVALVEIDGFKRSDITTFASCFGLPTGRIKVFHVFVRRNLTPSFESTLDLEMLAASAPGVYSRGVDVYQTVPTGSVVLRALTAPLRHPNNRPDVISASLGICEPNLLGQTVGRAGADAFNRTLEVAAADGVSVISSAGDSGSTACLNPTFQPEIPLRHTAVSFPASSPWVTGVGGTNLALTAGNGIAGQVVWNNSPALPDAGGGGDSRLFRRPGYQRRFTRSRRRVVPDLSILADPFPGYLIYCSARPGCVNSAHHDAWTPFGGTSAGAPLLAGSFALVDAELRTHGHPNLGFANPLLYKIARSKLRDVVFRDVRVGSNDVFTGRGVGCCSAKRGFDAASGLGSINVGALILGAVAETHRYARLGVHVPRQHQVLRAGALRVNVQCSRACRFVAYTTIRITGRRILIKAKSRPHTRHRGGRASVTIRLPARARGRIATALRQHHRVTANLYAAIVDPTGKIVHHTHGAKLRIRS
jgi:subtilase family serine protease